MLEAAAFSLFSAGASLLTGTSKRPEKEDVADANANSFIANLFNSNDKEVKSTSLSFADISKMFDVTGISPTEVDQLAGALKSSGAASDQDIAQLQTMGADFLSGLPGNNYSDDALNQKTDLLSAMQSALSQAQAAGDPTETLTSQVSLLSSLAAANSAGAAQINSGFSSNLSSRTLRTLIALQG
ncbi:MAG: hypothetical protein P1V34_14040 [Alphaproteobacteria bacterium]|nr:hypothetical protein [Alphaproteobacteria bacterium]